MIAAAGGEPKQLTFYPAPGPLPQRWGFDNQVYGWTPDGTAILFRSWRDSVSHSNPQLYTISVDGGLPTKLPMPVAGIGRYSPDGKQIVYSPKYRDFRTWNRYVGGWAQDLYIYDFAAKSAKNITNDPNTDRDPVWIGDAIYFIADRGEHLNLYRYDTGSGETKQLTDYKNADARWASGDSKGQIAFEVDGVLHVYDVNANQDRALAITVPSDLVRTRAEERSVKDKIEDFALSANGKRALFTARGEVFSVPLKDGITLDLTHTPGAHEREAAWAADGKRVAYISDQSGEEAIWVRDADGNNAHQLTNETFGRLYAPRWSPDGARIAFVDSESRIHIVASSGGPAPVIADDPGISRRDYVWSPGGHYLAYTIADKDTQQTQLFVRDLAANKSVHIGDTSFDAYQPAFSPDGKYLYFLGNREWAPQLSNIEWNFAANRDTGIFALTLRKGLDDPFAPRNDSASKDDKKEGDADKNGDKDKGDDKSKDKPKPASEIDDRIDFDGIDQRLVRAPIDPDNIQWIAVTGKSLLYVVTDAQYYGRDGAFKPKLKSVVVRGPQERGRRSKASTTSRSRPTATPCWSATTRPTSASTSPRASPKRRTFRPTGCTRWSIRRPSTPKIFREVWRRYRDHFYVTNMHGYDWNALRAKYEPRLADVGDRSDLNYLLGQMVAELSVGHAYVSGGDIGLPPEAARGLARRALRARRRERPLPHLAHPARDRTTRNAIARR